MKDEFYFRTLDERYEASLSETVQTYGPPMVSLELAELKALETCSRGRMYAALKVLILNPAIRAFLTEHDAPALAQAETAVRESMPPAPATKFYFHHSGDPSVGIDGEGVTVSYEGTIDDAEYKEAFRSGLLEAFQNIFDSTRVTVIEEHEHVCRYCQRTFLHFDEYCDLVCPAFACQAKDENCEACAAQVQA